MSVVQQTPEGAIPATAPTPITAYLRVVGGVAVESVTMAPTTGSSGLLVHAATFTVAASSSYTWTAVDAAGNGQWTGKFETDASGNEISLGGVQSQTSAAQQQANVQAGMTAQGATTARMGTLPTTGTVSTLTQSQVTGYAGPILTDNSTGLVTANATQFGGQVPVQTGGKLWTLDSSGNAINTGDVTLNASQNFDNTGQTTPVQATGYTGGGLYALTVNVANATTTVTGATVTIEGAQGANPSVTGSNGNAGVALNAGTVTVNVSAPGYLSYTSTQTVNSSGEWVSTGTAMLAVVLTPNTPTIVPGPGQTVGTLVTYDANGNPRTGVVTKYKCIAAPASASGSQFPTDVNIATSGSGGLQQIEMAYGYTYRFWTNRGETVDFTAPLSGSTCTLPAILGDYNS